MGVSDRTLRVGTREYVYPFGSFETYEASDIYPTGIMLFEMIMGHRPYEQADKHELDQAKFKMNIDYDYREDLLSPEVKSLILKSLNPDKDFAFNNFDEFIDCLDVALVKTLDLEISLLLHERRIDEAKKRLNQAKNIFLEYSSDGSTGEKKSFSEKIAWKIKKLFPNYRNEIYQKDSNHSKVTTKSKDLNSDSYFQDELKVTIND